MAFQPLPCLRRIHSFPGLKGYFLLDTTGGCWPLPLPANADQIGPCPPSGNHPILPWGHQLPGPSMSTGAGREVPLTAAQTLSNQNGLLPAGLRVPLRKAGEGTGRWEACPACGSA